MSKIVTAAVEEKAEREFRSVAMSRYGKRKGSYGKALSEAMRVWARKESTSVNEEALRLLRKGLHLGKVTHRREELHER